MFLEKVVIFVLFLGPLIFFHELGHFFFARLFGVRVEVFSLGFGPKLFKFKKHDTEYALSIIPLGGYVKMFGDDPFDKEGIPEDQKQYSFNHKGKWARFWIVLGGPLANFLLAFFIFFFLLISGERMPEIKVGVIEEKGKLFSQGLRTGDVLKKINNQKIYNISDVALQKGGKVFSITVERKKSLRTLDVNFQSESFFNEFIKHPPILRKPLLVDEKGKKYLVSEFNDGPRSDESLDMFSVEKKSNKLFLYSFVEGKAENQQLLKKLSIQYKSTNELLNKMVEKEGLYSLDLVVRSVKMGSPADKAGLKVNDIIVSLNNIKVTSFTELKETLQGLPEKPVSLRVIRNGKFKTFSMTPELREINKKKVRLIGVWSLGEYLSLNFVTTESKGFFGSVSIGIYRTWDSIEKTLTGFKKLITSESSLKNIGGPLSIGKVATDSFNTSLSYFFQLMALISVNLGIINLFPIPVLDGGHIMFIFLEIINRGPLSRRKMEIAQQVGLSMLLMLMIGAIFNDFTRFF
ncbi:MAG: hypothetical protein CME68_00205 [Halobacteriovoraceae bacterium]|nr:hypothetical protein [Halobacteriovoraceae bacterium]